MKENPQLTAKIGLQRPGDLFITRSAEYHSVISLAKEMTIAVAVNCGPMNYKWFFHVLPILYQKHSLIPLANILSDKQINTNKPKFDQLQYKITCKYCSKYDIGYYYAECLTILQCIFSKKNPNIEKLISMYKYILIIIIYKIKI